MVLDEDDIREQDLSQEEYLDRAFIQPEDAPTDVYWPDYFDNHPESRPGEHTRLEEDDDGTPVLKWSDGEFDIELRGVEKEQGFPGGDWRAVIHLPEEVGAHFWDEHDVKCRYPPMLNDEPEGYVEAVRTIESGHIAEAIVLRLNETEGMPLVLVETYPDMLREEAQRARERHDEIQNKLFAASENEHTDE